MSETWSPCLEPCCADLYRLPEPSDQETVAVPEEWFA